VIQVQHHTSRERNKKPSKGLRISSLKEKNEEMNAAMRVMNQMRMERVFVFVNVLVVLNFPWKLVFVFPES
jgi:hypothetical protein